MSPCRTATRDGFQPTLPARGATEVVGARVCIPVRISTHAPRTGSDHLFPFTVLSYTNFNPRSPHGERRDGSARYWVQLPISTHAPRTGSDCASARTRCRANYFNPRSPHGERPNQRMDAERPLRHFNPRSPHGERQISQKVRNISLHFNPRSPHGERPNLR